MTKIKDYSQVEIDEAVEKYLGLIRIASLETGNS
jgi:hypothetical protein